MIAAGAALVSQAYWVLYIFAAFLIFTGIKISIAVSWAVVVAAELIAAQAGLGFIIEDAGTFFRTPEVLIGVFIIGAIGLLFEIAITAVERRVLHWQSKA